LTVPSGNPGSITFSFGAGYTWQYSKNGGAFTALTNGSSITFANNNTISVKLQGIPCSEGDTLTATDATTGASVGSFDAGNTATCGGNGPMNAGPTFTSITYSVWDGDWALLEEYDKNRNLIEKYVQGYHGLVKTFQNVVYYYQDELGSTSHIAGGTGALIESYQYDLYGKPRVYNTGGTYQPNATPVARDLFTGQRWVVEIGLYDDRNRFMSTELGRFLQPDPIGFKGDASNLYRYCGNDWSNRTDPMGLLPVVLDAETEAYVQRAVGATVDATNKYYRDSMNFVQKIYHGLQGPEHSTTVIQQNNSSRKDITATRTDGRWDQVRFAPAPSGWREIVDVHNHPVTHWNIFSGSHMDSHDIARGIVTGRTQVVRFPDGSQERYRPSEKSTWQEREKDPGAIDRRPANGDWAPFKGSNPQPADITHERLENLASQQQVDAHSEQASSAEPPDIGGTGFVMFIGGASGGLSRGGPP
jgi:RHS repeat-associated protein